MIKFVCRVRSLLLTIFIVYIGLSLVINDKIYSDTNHFNEPHLVNDAQDEVTPSKKVLILYDSSRAEQWLGYIYSMMLANLLGHFQQDYMLVAVEQYTNNLIEQFDTTFYLGTIYNNTLPVQFLHDVLKTTKTIVWCGNNLEQISQLSSHFSTKYGFIFDVLDASGFPTIIYKQTALVKNILDPTLGKVLITKPNIAKIVAMATNSENAIPYIVHGNNLWYVADVPFSYITENDRYLVLADVLYDVLRIHAVPQKRAIVRLEDIDPNYDTKILRQFADYLYAENIPFAVSVIPCYSDSLGYYNSGTPVLIKMTDNADFIATLQYMVSKGGTLIQHGYTHQYSNIINPYEGISGSDYEFFRIVRDLEQSEMADNVLYQPLDEDSDTWVKERVDAGKELFKAAGLKTTIWETPHYTASYIDNLFFANNFAAVIGRIIYFDSNDITHSAGQFFPYVIYKDMYGGKVIPENLGCVSPSPWFNYSKRTVEDIVYSAKNNLVIRDAWASFCYHPFLGLSYLQQLIPSLKELGYTFVSVSPEVI